MNIPEFVNVPPGGLERIDPQATEFYRVATMAFESMEKGQMGDAVQHWRNALQLDPDDAQAHFGLAVALIGNNQEREAVEEYRKACALDSHQAAWFAHLAASLALDPANAGTQADLGAALFESGQTQEGIEQMRKAVDMAPEFADGHSYLGTALAKTGRMDDPQCLAALADAYDKTNRPTEAVRCTRQAP